MARNVGIDQSKVFLWISFGFLFLVLSFLVTIILVFAYIAKDLPDPNKVVRREGYSTKIYDRSSELLYDVFSDQRRTPINISQVPLYVRQATVSIEDKNFYTHSGFDPFGMLRALIRSVVYHRLEGGSTLTQQLVKNTLLDSRQTLSRKLKEFILTLQIEQKYSKDQILQMYLNEAPYGGTAWGIEAATESYFGKNISELGLSEAAILAGLPQAPSVYSPYAGKHYINRSKEVLRRMREDGYITSNQEKTAFSEVEKMTFLDNGGILKAPHFVFYVKQQLIDRYGEKAVEQGGLRVYTSLDLKLQEFAQKTVSDELDKVKNLQISNGAALVVDPNNGHILAMVGSKSWHDTKIDGKYNVILAQRQPGSTIKPVVYLSGIRKGYTASTMLMDTKTIFPGGDQKDYVPENYDEKFRGPISVRSVLGNSINVPAVKMLGLVGVKNFLDIAYNMGLNTLKPTQETMNRVGLSVALGGGEVRPIEIVSAYSAFANGGIRRDPVSILKITDADGRVLEEWKDLGGKPVLSAGESFLISSILSDPKAREITFGPRSAINVDGKNIAVKTGTTNDKRDNWTIGWTPTVVVGVWVGNNDNSPMKELVSGVAGAAPIWRKIILNYLGDKKEEFSPPEDVIQMDVDNISGYKAHDGFASRSEYFIKGTEPISDDPIHKKIRNCSGGEEEFLFLKEDDPVSGDGKNRWQEGIDEWLRGQSDVKYHPKDSSCGNQIWITVNEPTDKSRIDNNDVKIKFDVSSPKPIIEAKFIVDGQTKETLNSAPWETTLNVSDGLHQIDIEAKDDGGNVGSRRIRISVNKDYVEPTP